MYYKFKLTAIDIVNTMAPTFTAGVAIYSVSNAELNQAKYALNGETPEFDCLEDEVKGELRAFAEGVLATYGLSFSKVYVYNSQPVSGSPAWAPTGQLRILHPSETHGVNICVAVQTTAGTQYWRQLAFKAEQIAP